MAGSAGGSGRCEWPDQLHTAQCWFRVQARARAATTSHTGGQSQTDAARPRSDDITHSRDRHLQHNLSSALIGAGRKSLKQDIVLTSGNTCHDRYKSLSYKGTAACFVNAILSYMHYNNLTLYICAILAQIMQ